MTAAPAPPPAWAALETALRQHRPVHLQYHGRQRLICPHALGWNHGRAMLLGYQTGGQTSSGTLHADPDKRWRCFHIDEIEHVTAADHTSPWGTADSYNPAHPFPAIDEVVIAITQATHTPVR